MQHPEIVKSQTECNIRQNNLNHIKSPMAIQPANISIKNMVLPVP